MRSVIVSHPHVAAFSAGFAGALAREGALAAYFTGVAVAAGSWGEGVIGALAARYPVARNRVVADVPASLLHALPGIELAARGAAALDRRLGPHFKAYDAMFAAHDAAVSLLRWPKDAAGVYAYEDGARWTFARARRLGLRRIWDLPLPHYLSIEDTLREEATRWPGAVVGKPHQEPLWKRERKDAELAQATLISVASAFTRRSVERVGATQPTLVVPYGFPVESFAPRPEAPRGRFTVLSVGTHDLRKGTPYLLEAWKRAALPDAELHLVGPLRLAASFLAERTVGVRHWPHVPKSELGARYAAADLLVFPTLGDGFGLVIQEAMCSGLPVMTTPCGGGPECLTDGVEGWLVPPRDIDALVERLRQAAGNRDALVSMGLRARARAESYTWRDAGQALVAGLRAHID